MNKTFQIDSNPKYGILDMITNQWLSSYPDDAWDGDIDCGNVHEFSSMQEATKAALSLTKSFRKHQKDAEIDWCIHRLNPMVTVSVSYNVKVIKHILA